MTVGWLIGLLAVTTASLVWLVLRLSYREGQQDERHENDRLRQTTALDAAHVRDRLVRDPAFARSVRDRFSR